MLKERIVDLESMPAAKSAVGAPGAHASVPLESPPDPDLLRNLLDSVPDGVFAKDTNGRYLYVNAAHAHVLGARSAADVVGKTNFEIVPREVAEHFQEVERSMFSSGMPLIAVDEPVIDAAGNRRWLSVTRVPLWSAKQRIVGLAGVWRDVTDLKRTAAELQRHKAMAEAATRAKSDILAKMSHEIRTPMNSVLGMTELALDTSLTPEQREYLEMIKVSADALLDLINEILDFSRIEAGRLELDAIEFGLRETLGEVLDQQAVRASPGNLEVVCRIDPQAPEMLIGDARRLRQVLANLISNAIKYTPNGEIVVSVDVASISTEEVFLRFGVRDTGIGIPEDKQTIVFEAFSQVENELTRKHGGSGLGLSITSQLVSLMGGQITVESQVGSGSLFSFVLPLGIAAEASISINRQLDDLPALVVEDNESARTAIVAMLEAHKVRVTAADNGHSALLALRNARDLGKPFAVALIDKSLPDMDGFAVAAAALRLSDPVRAVVMMLPAGERREDAARGRELGIHSFLVKPIKEGQLIDALEAAAMTTLFVAPSGRETPATASSTRRLSLLLAEDNEINQRLASRILEKRGHHVTVVGDGQKAADVAVSGDFDLVLMDVEMPIMDGYVATALIRDREKITGRHIPIVAMTAHAMKGDREKCLEAGMDFYISKPIQPQELIEVVEKLTRSINDTRSTNDRMEDPNTMTDGIVFNRQAALDRVEGDSDLLMELVTLFFEQSPTLLHEIDAAIASRDTHALRAAAHSLKGSAGNFGATAAYEGADKLEQIAVEGDLAPAPEAAAALREEIGKLTAALQTYCDEVAEDV